MVKSKSILGENQNTIICIVIIIVVLFLLLVVIPKFSTRENFSDLPPDCQKMDFWGSYKDVFTSCDGIKNYGLNVNGVLDRDYLSGELKQFENNSGDAEKCLKSCGI